MSSSWRCPHKNRVGFFQRVPNWQKSASRKCVAELLAGESSDEGGDVDGDGLGDASDPDDDADRVAARLAGGVGDDDDDDPNDTRVEMDRAPRPQPGCAEDAEEADPAWARRSAEERASAAGAAAPAKDRRKGDPAGVGDAGRRGPGFGVLFNPKGYNWTDPDEPCNVHWREYDRLKALRDKWYGKAFVGDGAEAVERHELDPWQKFAHDLVARDRSAVKDPLRLLLLGTAGTGKSRTVRSVVSARRARVREQWEHQVWRARLAALSAALMHERTRWCDA